MAEIPHFDVVVSAENYTEDFMEVLQKIRPLWKADEVMFKLSPKTVNRGLLNTMVRCYREDDKTDDVVMLRILNAAMSEFMDRAIEVSCIKYLQPRDCAPTLLATFKTGYCYEFIKGEILNNLRLREDPIWRRIAEELAKIHAANVEDIPGFTKNVKFVEFVQKCEVGYPAELKDPKKNERFKKELPEIEILKKEIDEALAHALTFEADLVLAHNDTRAENIIWNKETGVAKFVDYEGVSYNYRAWELANHFQRFGGLEPMDFSLIPDEEFQLAWLRVYLEKYFEVIGRRKSDVTDVNVRRLYVQIRKFHLVGLIMMGFAGPTVENMAILPNNQVDMIGFAIDAVKEYFKAKEETFALQMPEK